MPEDPARRPDGFDPFAKLLNLRCFHVAQHSARPGQIIHLFRQQAHDATGGGIHRNRIVTKKENSCSLWRTPVTFSTPRRISIAATASSMERPTRAGIVTLKRIIIVPTTKIVNV